MLSMFDDLGANLSVNAIRHANVLSGLIKGCYLNKVEAPLAEAEQAADEPEKEQVSGREQIPHEIPPIQTGFGLTDQQNLTQTTPIRTGSGER